jgi:hypothetical protein
MTDSLGSAFGLLGQSIVLGATIRVVDSSLSSFGKKRKKKSKSSLGLFG